jgi:hypothetical protein
VAQQRVEVEHEEIVAALVQGRLDLGRGRDQGYRGAGGVEGALGHAQRFGIRVLKQYVLAAHLAPSEVEPESEPRWQRHDHAPAPLPARAAVCCRFPHGAAVSMGKAYHISQPFRAQPGSAIIAPTHMAPRDMAPGVERRARRRGRRRRPAALGGARWRSMAGRRRPGCRGPAAIGRRHAPGSLDEAAGALLGWATPPRLASCPRAWCLPVASGLSRLRVVFDCSRSACRDRPRLPASLSSNDL